MSRMGGIVLTFVNTTATVLHTIVAKNRLEPQVFADTVKFQI